jgi:ribonuclease HI
MSSSQKRLIAACDGATKGNPGPSAWAWVLADADGTVLRWRSGPLGHATNNIAELTALRELLVEVGVGARVEARLDSQYTINAVTKWLPAWKKNGWMTAGKKPVANADLIREIDALLGSRDIVFVHVAAHQVNGDPYNDLADRAASASAVSQQALAGTDASQVPLTPDRPAGSGRAGGGRSSGSGGSGSRSSSSASSAATGNGATSSGDAKPKKAFTIQAKFAGTCSCGQGYGAGEKITKLDSGRWGHPACA